MGFEQVEKAGSPPQAHGPGKPAAWGLEGASSPLRCEKSAPPEDVLRPLPNPLPPAPLSQHCPLFIPLLQPRDVSPSPTRRLPFPSSKPKKLRSLNCPWSKSKQAQGPRWGPLTSLRAGVGDKMGDQRRHKPWSRHWADATSQRYRCITHLNFPVDSELRCAPPSKQLLWQVETDKIFAPDARLFLGKQSLNAQDLE